MIRTEQNMSSQSEAALENGLINTLRQMSYEYVRIEEERTYMPISRNNWKSITGRDLKRSGEQDSPIRNSIRFLSGWKAGDGYGSSFSTGHTGARMNFRYPIR